MKLADGVVLVTGAGHGMGRAHCLQLAREGARVGVMDIDEEAARETVAAVEAEGGQGLMLMADVTDRSAVEAAVAQLGQHFGGLGGVVSNAGVINSTARLEDTDDADWARVFAVHVNGALNVTRAALPLLRASEGASIVVISSLWAQKGPGYAYAYCAAKGALLAYARNMAAEFGPEGIRVNSITPGSVFTRATAKHTQEEIDADCKSIPLGRWAASEEVSGVVSFLLSDNASYMTGQTLSVAGGQVIAGN